MREPEISIDEVGGGGDHCILVFHSFLEIGNSLVHGLT